jgi:Fe2+ transport system protein FeoA
MASDEGDAQEELPCLADLDPGLLRRIARITGGRDVRRSLIDMGFIQGAEVMVDRPGSESLPCVVTLDGYRLEIPVSIARSVLLHSPPSESDVQH